MEAAEVFAKCPISSWCALPNGHTSVCSGRPFLDSLNQKCPACKQRIRPKREADPAAQAGPKQRSRIRIDIPVAEREHGADDFAHLVHRCAEKLAASGALDYTEETPAWYIVFAVLQDWADTE